MSQLPIPRCPMLITDRQARTHGIRFQLATGSAEIASALQPETEDNRYRRHLRAGWNQAESGKPQDRKGPAVSGKNATEQKLRGRVSEIRPVSPARSAPRPRHARFCAGAGAPAQANAYAKSCARRFSARRIGAASRVTSEKLCRAQHELHFQAATYLCLLRSIREHVALHQEFHGKGERSVEESAGLVGLKLPHQPGGKGWEP
ncbi:protein FMC1 homolog isoform X1 [Equus asinus]|uniref:Protein FMC1 homolog n=1 Tax=Equus asinus TaxID=9793 RepID=A0A9L0I8D1_EQUAS